MSRNQTKRMDASVLTADQNSFAALKSVAGYAPANPAYALATITEAQAALTQAQQEEVQTAAAAAAARDKVVAKEWEFHNLILGAKDQVVAQFGRDSNEVQALGLKKASERKKPQRKAGTSEPQR